MAKEQPGSLEDAWLIRPCEVYKEEYHDCKRMISRMYQFYVDGHKSDCSQWLQDFNNCMSFRNKKDTKAAKHSSVVLKRSVVGNKLKEKGKEQHGGMRTSILRSKKRRIPGRNTSKQKDQRKG